MLFKAVTMNDTRKVGCVVHSKCGNILETKPDIVVVTASLSSVISRTNVQQLSRDMARRAVPVRQWVLCLIAT